MNCKDTPFLKTPLTLACSQDTNTMQYELMFYIAESHRCVTIVGDPDQSSAFIFIGPSKYANRGS